MAYIQKILEKKLEGADNETKKLYFTAERICRREYEKEFHVDLSLPIGHPKNLMMVSHENLSELMNFWETLKEKYFNKCNPCLADAIAYFCDLHWVGAFNFYKECGFI